MLSRLRRLLSDEDGQAMAEYAVTVFFLLFCVWFVVSPPGPIGEIFYTFDINGELKPGSLLDAIPNFAYDVTSVICLPVP